MIFMEDEDSLAEGRGLELNSLGGVLITPGGCCGEVKLGASPQVFDGARQGRDWPRCIALHPAGKSLLLNPALLRCDPPVRA